MKASLLILTTTLLILFNSCRNKKSEAKQFKKQSKQFTTNDFDIKNYQLGCNEIGFAECLNDRDYPVQTTKEFHNCVKQHCGINTGLLENISRNFACNAKRLEQCLFWNVKTPIIPQESLNTLFQKGEIQNVSNLCQIKKHFWTAAFNGGTEIPATADTCRILMHKACAPLISKTNLEKICALVNDAEKPEDRTYAYIGETKESRFKHIRPFTTQSETGIRQPSDCLFSSYFETQPKKQEFPICLMRDNNTLGARSALRKLRKGIQFVSNSNEFFFGQPKGSPEARKIGVFYETKSKNYNTIGGVFTKGCYRSKPPKELTFYENDQNLFADGVKAKSLLPSFSTIEIKHINHEKKIYTIEVLRLPDELPSSLSEDQKKYWQETPLPKTILMGFRDIHFDVLHSSFCQYDRKISQEQKQNSSTQKTSPTERAKCDVTGLEKGTKEYCNITKFSDCAHIISDEDWLNMGCRSKHGVIPLP